MKKKLKNIAIIVGMVLAIALILFLKLGRREVKTVYNPLDDGYYVTFYQIGYLKDYEYHCICILYGPNGEISREYLDAMSTDQLVKRHMDNRVAIEWNEDHVSVSVRDPEEGGLTRNFYLDGKITSEKCHWGADF
ncbi:hypothetical protein SAMN02745229_02539 [Butyrivibrio fibrisolvens DSM 3071]|uniref:Uncharacterized protein n=1 Tax=Butyrivibrio fibrisolvens DSM 3071 TaxID=1121131 RepID=A0A1M5ZPR3_BUTFI|nr:hypothetical protein [Butyrivibrio fibrisolvens]SHI26202.1 hypothetical protein SAMN02745229_02539 [Butyrivibrio fibrisolvens DSM 3071]